MKKRTNRRAYPEHFTGPDRAEETVCDALGHIASDCPEPSSEQDRNFETAPRDDFASHDEPL